MSLSCIESERLTVQRDSETGCVRDRLQERSSIAGYIPYCSRCSGELRRKLPGQLEATVRLSQQPSFKDFKGH